MCAGLSGEAWQAGNGWLAVNGDAETQEECRLEHGKNHKKAKTQGANLRRGLYAHSYFVNRALK